MSNFLFIFLSIFVLSCPALELKEPAVQSSEMRELCKKAQELEKKTNKLRLEIDSINQKEKVSATVVRNIYEILTSCFTILFNMQRFSNLLVLRQENNKNDFVKCSIIVKNFASYFKLIDYQLEKARTEVLQLKKSKQNKMDELKTEIAEYNRLFGEIEVRAEKLAQTRGENIIQNDVVYHLATKSESLEELDAELEAENAVGVLKNTKISTDLALAYPVVGKIVSEFGDKGANGEMIYYISFETHSDAIVTSPAKGLVVFSGRFLNYGNILIISNGEYRVFLYGVDVLFPATGDTVEIGDYVGKMKAKVGDNNPTVKMELKKSGEPLDPRHWLLETINKNENEKQ
ncbi:MAG: peptidoglycan DD-metalloendopeptidase family protein [Holosporaceae bacterium]|jgi:septal ring factor EnvC (AmiA/AmiB activator)|nr:peptidoglycan DD-metalloendopeptidase family protein [Holosporaceae bacterium]